MSKINKETIMDKITLKNVEVVFANLEDEGFGKSITVNATDKTVKDAITKWVVDNKIGKADNAGKPNFKDYEGKLQYSFKINDYTIFGFNEGLDKSNLGFGSTVSITAKSFSYDNKFGKGNSGALSAVFVEGRAKTGADEDLADLMGDLAPNDKVNTDLDTTDYSKAIDMSDIPF
jgi:hypothetical protein